MPKSKGGQEMSVLYLDYNGDFTIDAILREIKAIVSKIQPAEVLEESLLSSILNRIKIIKFSSIHELISILAQVSESPEEVFGTSSGAVAIVIDDVNNCLNHTKIISNYNNSNNSSSSGNGSKSSRYSNTTSSLLSVVISHLSKLTGNSSSLSPIILTTNYSNTFNFSNFQENSFLGPALRVGGGIEQAAPSANEQIWNRIVSNRILLRVCSGIGDDDGDSDRSKNELAGTVESAQSDPEPASIAPRDGATGSSVTGTDAYPGGTSGAAVESWGENRVNKIGTVRSQAVFGSLVMSSKYPAKSVAVPW
ncbi:hypothetical protein AYI70_g10971 [Smittium culicis]|uniref:Uncharacterized protein n=1 Tax=Smittium culicis TaxID=133412 RepID=A0A1R1X3X9_9FUNG|nr:hypothetical protein AYI70_g10971 [Smittium culicis]